MVETTVVGWRMGLLSDKALWLPEPRWLLVADAHLGKAHSFRKLGLPVPGGTTADNLARLSALIASLQPQHLVFLGDLLHSAHSQAPGVQTAVAAWRSQHAALPITLVRGNHDSHAGDPPAAWGMAVVDEPLVLSPPPGQNATPLLLCHHPDPRPDGYVLAGHWHPCVTPASRVDRLRLPCFWLGRRVGVLPAFGAFTGMHPVRPQPGDQLWALAGEQVLRV